MAEYIDREEALMWFRPYLHMGEDNIPIDTVLEDLRHAIPKADVAPVRHGRWNRVRSIYRCTVCERGYKISTGAASPATFNFCPNCGARMDLGGADNGET